MMTLQQRIHPTIQQIHQHKWPLRPGVQVHVNGSKSISLSDSGSVSLSLKKQSQEQSNQVGCGNRSATVQTSSSSHHNLSTEKFLAEENGPYYETLRGKKRSVVCENQSIDSGSESTRSVIRVHLPCRMKSTKLPVLNDQSTSNDPFDKPTLLGKI